MAYKLPRAVSAHPITEFQYLQAPMGGLDTDTPLMFMPEGYAPVLDNFIPRNNKIVMREGFGSAEKVSLWPGGLSSLNVSGAVRNLAANYPSYTFGRYTTTGVPAPLAAMATISAIAGGFPMVYDTTLYFADPSTTTPPGMGGTTPMATTTQNSTGTTVNGPPLPPTTPRHPVNGLYSYYVGAVGGTASGSTVQTRIGLLPVTYVCSLSGASVGTYDAQANTTFGSLGQYTPVCPTAVYYWQQRLWALGGGKGPVASGTSMINTYSPNNIYFTQPGYTDSTTGGWAQWCDPITNAQNQFTINESAMNPGMGLASWGEALLVFHRHSIWVIRGTAGTANGLTQTRLSRRVGCIDQRSILETDEGVYFVSEDGLYLTTGTGIRAVSGRVKHSMEQAIAMFLNAVIRNSQNGCVSSALLTNGDVMVSIQTQYTSGAPAMRTIWSGVYRPSTGAWYRVSTMLHQSDTDPSLTANTPSPVGQLYNDLDNNLTLSIGNNRVVVIEDGVQQRLIDAQAFTSPWVKDCFDYDNASSANTYYPIPARWATPLIGYAPAARFYAHPKSYFVDYLLGQSTSLSHQLYAQFALLNSDNTAVAAGGTQDSEVQTLGGTQITAPAWPYIDRPSMTLSGPQQQHNWTDIVARGEQAHWWVDITFKGWQNPTGAIYANNMLFEVYGVGINYQAGRQIRDTAVS